jgi:hypothetical protein
MSNVLDTEAHLLIGFFQQAFQLGGGEPDPAKYLDKFRSEIDDTGRFFGYLKLAKPKKRSPLGWKPTAPLSDFIAKKPSTRSASLVDQLVLDLLLDTVLGDEDHTFMRYVLTRLGLAVEHVDYVWTATPQLVQLFGDAYYIRRLSAAHDPDAGYEVVHTS